MKAFFLSLFAFAITTLNALPISSAYFAKKWLEHHHSTFSTQAEKDEFIIGAIFPDIRYMNVHVPYDLKEITSRNGIFSANTPFEAGVRFHHYLSVHRLEFLNEIEIEQSLTEVPDEGKELFLHIMEEQFFQGFLSYTSLWRILSEVPRNALLFGLPKYTLKTWQQLIAQYFSMSPQSILSRLKEYNLGAFKISKETVAIWAIVLKELMEKPEVRFYLDDLHAFLMEECIEID